MERVNSLASDSSLTMNQVIEIIRNIERPKGKIPFYMKIMYTKQMIAELTFDSTKQEIINILELSK